MKTNIFFIGFILVMISCSKKEKASSTIVANLSVSKIDNPFSKSMSPLQFVDSINNEFKGIKDQDSSFVMFLNTINYRKVKDAIKQGKINQETIDSATTKIYLLSGFNKGKQFYVIDINNNKDFSDDEVIEFEKNVTENKKYQDLFEIKKLEITKFSTNKLYKQKSYLQFLPAPDYFTYKQETEEEKFMHSLQLVALKHDYLYGTFNVSEEEFGVGVNEGLFGNEFIFKKSDTIFYPLNHQLFSKFKLKDTIKLNDKHFRIDSLIGNPARLIINELNDLKLVYGFNTNEVSKNYTIDDLNGNSTNLKELAKQKGFLFLDFWGTWCAPCKELTPELVKLHQQYNNQIQFVSLAFELDPKPVIEYTEKNQMNWYNGIIRGKPKSGDMSSPIIGGLRVECFPTFIILDSDLNILYRTCGGGDNYEGLKEYLSSEFE
ncbi:TlpA family protein disulfide reductase [Nonlabens sp. SCSIO 43208]|uniref:TlpA family protein disulfide reductase n=1 Tax=Nonlabens sp. SCSIO 43208 TaxID=2793009 RepID=UPI003D6B3A9B